MTPYVKPSFITFLGLNNNPVLNGGIKLTFIYSLTPHPLYALQMKK